MTRPAGTGPVPRQDVPGRPLGGGGRSTGVVVRRVAADEWARARDLRLEALQDPEAVRAFLTSYAQASAQPDSVWQERTALAARGGQAAQLVATAGDEWVGTVTVVVQGPGATDVLGRPVSEAHGTVVAVYVRPGSRSAGAVDELLDAAADWARGRGLVRLTLDVHRDNPRAQGAYRRCGFVPTGRTFTGPVGPEVEMARPVRPTA